VSTTLMTHNATVTTTIGKLMKIRRVVMKSIELIYVDITATMLL